MYQNFFIRGVPQKQRVNNLLVLGISKPVKLSHIHIKLQLLKKNKIKILISLLFVITNLLAQNIEIPRGLKLQ